MVNKMFANKKIFKNSNKEIHIGLLAPQGFSEGSLEDVKNILDNLGDKKIWRCNVCNDLHIGPIPLKICPTCMQEDVYVQINEKEIKNLLEIA